MGLLEYPFSVWRMFSLISELKNMIREERLKFQLIQEKIEVDCNK